MIEKPLASRLLGHKITKWNIFKKIDKTEDDNSGFFSSCYIAKDENGNLAFFKAFNYFYAFGSRANSADKMKEMTEDFTYERDILLFCKEHKMTRVVKAIDSGEYCPPGEMIPVPYLVFELAEGNLKSHSKIKDIDLACKLNIFHGALVGLNQLHYARIAHQDIKPTNILIFGENYSKISDLGRATKFDNNSKHEGGDMRYAPVELLYGYISSEWDTRKYGADLFMMGGILCFLISNSNFLGLMISKLPPNMQPRSFGGKFEELKPYLLESYYKTLEEVQQEMPENIRKDLLMVLSELTHPIPEDRGNPKKLFFKQQQYSLIRYISIIDRLSKRVQLGTK